MNGRHIDKTGDVWMMRDSSGQVGGLDLEDADVGRRGAAGVGRCLLC